MRRLDDRDASVGQPGEGAREERPPFLLDVLSLSLLGASEIRKWNADEAIEHAADPPAVEHPPVGQTDLETRSGRSDAMLPALRPAELLRSDKDGPETQCLEAVSYPRRDHVLRLTKDEPGSGGPVVGHLSLPRAARLGWGGPVGRCLRLACERSPGDVRALFLGDEVGQTLDGGFNPREALIDPWVQPWIALGVLQLRDLNDPLLEFLQLLLDFLELLPLELLELLHLLGLGVLDLLEDGLGRKEGRQGLNDPAPADRAVRIVERPHSAEVLRPVCGAVVVVGSLEGADGAGWQRVRLRVALGTVRVGRRRHRRDGADQGAPFDGHPIVIDRDIRLAWLDGRMVVVAALAAAGPVFVFVGEPECGVTQ